MSAMDILLSDQNRVLLLVIGCAVLWSLESGPRHFRIQSLTVTQADPVGRPDTPERLSIELAFSTLSFEVKR